MIIKSAPSRADINIIRKMAAEGATVELIARATRVKKEAIIRYAASDNIEIVDSPDSPKTDAPPLAGTQGGSGE